MRTYPTCFPVPARRGRRWQVRTQPAGFTLVEMLVVIAIATLLVGLLTLGVRGINGSTARRSAVGTLMGVFDQARGVAVSDGRSTYVVFVSAPKNAAPDGAGSVAPTMWGRAYALFEDPVLTDATTATSFQPQQRSNWLYLPTGVAFKSAPGTPESLTDSGPKTNDAKVVFMVPASNGTASLVLPYVKFDATGQIVDHTASSQVMPPDSTQLRVLLFEGATDKSGTETITRLNASAGGAKYALDEILLKPTTGRAKYTLDPSYNLATANN